MHRNPCEVIWGRLAELFNLIKHLWALGRETGEHLGAGLSEVLHITCCPRCCSEPTVELMSLITAAEPVCLAPWSISSLHQHSKVVLGPCDTECQGLIPHCGTDLLQA